MYTKQQILKAVDDQALLERYALKLKVDPVLLRQEWELFSRIEDAKEAGDTVLTKSLTQEIIAIQKQIQ